MQQELARVPADPLWTQPEGMNWFAERTLDDISDGATRRLITLDDLDTLLPSTTDDITEGTENKYWSSERVVDVLRQTSVDVMLNGDATSTRERVERVVSELAPSLISPLRDEIETMAISCASATADLHLLLSERLQKREPTTLDDVPDGTERKLLLQGDVQSMLATLSLEDVSETNAFLHFKVEDKARLDDVSHRMDAAYSRLESHNLRLESTAIETARATEVTSALQKSLLELTTASVPESSSALYFTSERAKAAALRDINTAVVPEAEGFLYFSTDRCLSVCMPTLSRYEETTASALRTMSSTVADLKVHDVETKHELDELRQRADGLRAVLSAGEVLDLLRGTTITELQTSQGQLQEEHQQLTLALTHVITRDQFNEDLRVYSERIESVEQWVQRAQVSSTTLSDDRLKHGESPLSDALSVVTALVPLSYTMVLSLGADVSEGSPDVGFIAQDVARIPGLAHAVTTGSETVPFSLDYHSITTYTVAAVNELNQLLTLVSARSSDDITEGLQNKFLTADNLKVAAAALTADDISPGTRNRYAEQLPPSVSLEEFRFLLQQIDSDEIPEGDNHLFHRVVTQTTDEVVEGSNLYFTAERCRNIIGAQIENRLNTITTDDIPESIDRKYLSFDRFLDFISEVTADQLASGVTNKFLTLDTFLDLGLTADDITDGETNKYFTEEKCRRAITNITLDHFTEGTKNLFSTVSNVRNHMLSLSTLHLNEHPTRRYVSRDSFFELAISVGDILDHETLARTDDVELHISATSLFHTHLLDQAVSASITRDDELAVQMRLAD
jgi:hypothetical protein